MRAVLLIALGLAAWSALGACEADMAGAAVQQLRSQRYAIAYRTRPEVPRVGEPFALELALCAEFELRGEAAPGIRVDAHMPAHRHGMNYLASVRRTGLQRYRVEGMVLHMPGRWELVFELTADGRVDRLAAELSPQ